MKSAVPLGRAGPSVLIHILILIYLFISSNPSYNPPQRPRAFRQSHRAMFFSGQRLRCWTLYLPLVARFFVSFVSSFFDAVFYLLSEPLVVDFELPN